MKTKFVLFLILLSLGGYNLSYAQITTGKPTSKVIRSGNRAQAGDFGIYLGATSDMLQAFDKDVTFTALPLINLKYMVTDQFEARIGLELYKTSKSFKGDAIRPDLNNPGENVTVPLSYKNASSNAMLYPGIAYHFSKRNLLDVYVGAELPLGWTSETLNGNTLDQGEVGGNLGYVIGESSKTKRAFVIGLGAFIGIQAYIADLPLALGAEFGISSRFDTGLKYKNVYTQGGETQTYYSPDLDFSEGESAEGINYDYSKLKAKTGEIGGQVRLTLTYYFK